MDGIWKLRFPHCMFPVKTEVCGVESVNYPSVCTEEPSNPQSAFCSRHCEIAIQKGIPTGLRDFIHNYCGISRGEEGQQSSVTTPWLVHCSILVYFSYFILVSEIVATMFDSLNSVLISLFLLFRFHCFWYYFGRFCKQFHQPFSCWFSWQNHQWPTKKRGSQSEAIYSSQESRYMAKTNTYRIQKKDVDNNGNWNSFLQIYSV